MRWALLFLVLAVAAGLFGYGVIGGPPRDGAQIGSILLAVIAMAVFVRSWMNRKTPEQRSAKTGSRDSGTFARRTTPVAPKG